jgi:Secretion system C-terminal sorting domain
MKNLLCTLLLFVAFTAFVNAQSVVSISPLPAVRYAPVENTDVEVDAHITNLTNNTIHMKWERQVISLSDSCETAVCDPNTCWFRTVSTKNFDMDANEVGDLLVHFYNNDLPCAGLIHLKVTNLDNPSDTIIGAYFFNMAVNTKDLPAANVKLYPNPATEFFSLENAENVAAVAVFALDGRKVARYEASGNNVYSLQNLPTGTYVIALEDKNGQAFQATELKKN